MKYLLMFILFVIVAILIIISNFFLKILTMKNIFKAISVFVAVALFYYFLIWIASDNPLSLWEIIERVFHKK